ncbi:VOC family protein [Streptomyces sp. NPDC014940]|uniref:VOC family protein n=1 Tax=Streptomyces sp. NPDC014940 TaxID=3364932 RepID=UPI003700C9CA
MSSIKKFQVTFDCAESERVARFLCEVPGMSYRRRRRDSPPGTTYDRSLPPERQGAAFACGGPSGVGPRLFFQRVPEGKVVKNRLHLDVRVDTGLVGEERLAALEAECPRLVAIGAVLQATALLPRLSFLLSVFAARCYDWISAVECSTPICGPSRGAPYRSWSCSPCR